MAYTFESCFASRIEDFSAQKNALGFGELESSRLLRDFDRFLPGTFSERAFADRGALLGLGHEKGYGRP